MFLLSQGPIIRVYLCVGKSPNIVHCLFIFLAKVLFNFKLTSSYFVLTAIPGRRPFPWSWDKCERKSFGRKNLFQTFISFLTLFGCPEQLEHLRLVHLLSNLTAIHNESETHTWYEQKCEYEHKCEFISWTRPFLQSFHTQSLSPVKPAFRAMF